MESRIRFKTCAHAPCICEPKRKSKFCSDYCESAKNMKKVEETCGCGHKGCGAIGVLGHPGTLVPETA